MPKSAKKLKLRVPFINAAEQGGGWHFLVVEKPIVEKMKFTGKSKRILCSIRGTEPFQCALMPWGEIFYIMVNKKRRTELGLEVGETVDIEIWMDESKYGMAMPEEFQEVLNQDPEADKLFHSLTEGKMRSLLYYIGTLKDIDKKIEHSLIITEHLKDHGKVVDKILYEELRRPMF